MYKLNTQCIFGFHYMNYNPLKYFKSALSLFLYHCSDLLLKTNSSLILIQVGVKQPVVLKTSCGKDIHVGLSSLLCRRKENCYSFTISDCKYTKIYIHG